MQAYMGTNKRRNKNMPEMQKPLLGQRENQMQITTKIVEDDANNTETRYFGKTDDGFDGTAQGYGYKSKEKLEKAYWFYKNKNKINAKKNKAKKFLKENPQIKRLLDNYFSAQNHLYAFKDGEKLTMESFLEVLKQEGNFEIIQKLNNNKDIWKSLLD